MQVVPAHSADMLVQNIKPGFERPKSGPTTNFVGRFVPQLLKHEKSLTAFPDIMFKLTQSEACRVMF